jgi:hypothetical protein
LWLLPWYPAGWIVLLVWSHFDRNFPFDLIFENHSRVFDWALNAFGIFGWISNFALILGVGLLCISGVKYLARLRRQSV